MAQYSGITRTGLWKKRKRRGLQTLSSLRFRWSCNSIGILVALIQGLRRS
ncbi:hypothetical protein [Candidatus Desulfosporosinus nitrosoreducens]